MPVFAFAEDVAASGGYWLALAADEIYSRGDLARRLDRRRQRRLRPRPRCSSGSASSGGSTPRARTSRCSIRSCRKSRRDVARSDRNCSATSTDIQGSCAPGAAPANSKTAAPGCSAGMSSPGKARAGRADRRRRRFARRDARAVRRDVRLRPIEPTTGGALSYALLPLAPRAHTPNFIADLADWIEARLLVGAVRAVRDAFGGCGIS